MANMSWTDTPLISQIKLPSGSTYYLKDDDARANIATLNTAVEALGNPFTYTVSTNAATTPKNVVAHYGSSDVTGTLTASASTENKIYLVPEVGVQAGNYNEYITIKVGSAYQWEKIGSTAADFGTLAGKNGVTVQYSKSATATDGKGSTAESTSITPAGTVSQPTFTGTAATITVSGTATGSVGINIDATGATKNYTPAGSVSQPTFSGTAATIEVAGDVSDTAVAAHSYTPAGEVSKPTFSGTAATITISGSVTGTSVSAHSYQPAGTVSKPGVTLTPTTTPVYSITGVGSLPSHSADSHTNTGFSVSNELLTITDGSFTSGTFSAGSLPTRSASAINVYTGLTAELSATPTFTGTIASLTHSVTQGSFSGTTSYTPAGSVTKPTFTGTAATLSHTVTQGTFSGSTSYTPAGTVTKPTFSGTSVAISGSFTGTTFNASTTYTPKGTVSQPTFTGTAATHTHAVSSHTHAITLTTTNAAVSYT